MSVIELESGEYVVGLTRKHWWRLFTWGVGLGFLALLPVVALGVFVSFGDKEVSDKILYTGGFFYSLWLLALWVMYFVEWTDYYLDVWVVTNHRVVDIDQAGLFSRDVATVRLEDIEDITVEVHGMLETFLKIGMITIQTAGSRNEFYLKNANNPEEAKQMIYSLVTESRKAEK